MPHPKQMVDGEVIVGEVLTTWKIKEIKVFMWKVDLTKSVGVS